MDLFEFLRLLVLNEFDLVEDVSQGHCHDAFAEWQLLHAFDFFRLSHHQYI